MLVLASDVITTAFDRANRNTVRLKAGTKVRLLKVCGSVATCAIGSPTFSLVFNLPLESLVRKAENEKEGETPTEEKEAYWEELEEAGELEKEEVPERKKMIHDPALQIREPGEEFTEPDLPPEFGESEPMGEYVGKFRIDTLKPNEMVALIRNLPAEIQQKILPDVPTEILERVDVKIPEKIIERIEEAIGGAGAYPNSEANYHRFLFWTMPDIFGWNMYDSKREKLYEVGEPKLGQAIANKIIMAETEYEASKDKPGVYMGYAIRMQYNPDDPEISFHVMDEDQREIEVTRTYDAAKRVVDQDIRRKGA